MGLREALSGFISCLGQNGQIARPQINVQPGLGTLEVVDTSKNPTRNNIPGSWSRTFLGPGQPFASMDMSQVSARDKDRESEPRAFQYVTSVNSTISPRLAYGLMAFSDLRFYAESVPEVSMCIRLLTEELKAFVPTIIDTQGNAISDSEYEWMTDRPDQFNPFPVWLSRFMYNTLVYDACTAYLVRNSRKKIIASRIIDGSTIFVLIDERGEQPRPPAPAFQQIIWGVPHGMYNTRQIWYHPRHLRADAPYGRSPVEDSLPAVKLLQNLWDYEGDKYIVGNIPEMGLTTPPEWKDDADAILEYEDAFNARMSGSNKERVRVRFFPSGTETLATKELTFNKDSYDAATNAVRMSFGILQSEVGEGPSGGLGGKGYAEAMQSAFYRMGLAPLISYIESHFNDILKMNGENKQKFKLEFPPESLDPSKEEEKYATRFENGGITRDEYRQGISMNPIGGEVGNFFITDVVDPGEGDDSQMPDFGGGGSGNHRPIKVINTRRVQVRRPIKVLKNPVDVAKNPVPVKKVDASEIKELGNKLGVDWDNINPDEFVAGVNEEMEHIDTVGSVETVAQIALDHLKEDPAYYTKLKGIFAKFDLPTLQKYCGVDPNDDLLFGSPASLYAEADMPHQGANESMIVSIGGTNDLDARPAVWKPLVGEKPDLQGWVKGTLFRRAEAAYLLDRELAPDEKHYLVPVAYITEIDGEIGSVQHYVIGRQDREDVSAYGQEWIEQAAVLDYIMGQVDRNGKNWLTHPHDTKRPVLIDNDLSFSPDKDETLHSTFVDAMTGRPLTQKTLDAIYLAIGSHDLWEDLQDCLEDEAAVANAKARAAELYMNGMIGGRDPDRVFVKFDDTEPRDPKGEWTAGGGSGATNTSPKVSENKDTEMPNEGEGIDGEGRHTFHGSKFSKTVTDEQRNGIIKAIKTTSIPPEHLEGIEFVTDLKEYGKENIYLANDGDIFYDGKRNFFFGEYDLISQRILIAPKLSESGSGFSGLILAHEIGHHVHMTLKGNDLSEDQIKEKMDIARKDVNKYGFIGYAFTNPHEFMAEVYKMSKCYTNKEALNNLSILFDVNSVEDIWR